MSGVRFTRRNGSLVATIAGVEYVIVKRDVLGLVSYRVVSWAGPEMTVHGEFFWLRDARAFIESLDGE